MLSITDHQGNANQTTMRYHLTSVKMAIIQKEKKINVGQHMENWNSFTLLVLTLWKKIRLLLFSRSVVSDSLLPHGLQHARPPCPSLTTRACSNSCPLSRWCHPMISSSVAHFSSCLLSFPASESFPMSQLFASGGQNIGVSASTPPMNIQGWSPLELPSLISLQCKELSRVFSSTTVQKHQFFGTQLSSQSNSHIHTWPLEKP